MRRSRRRLGRRIGIFTGFKTLGVFLEKKKGSNNNKNHKYSRLFFFLTA